MRAKGKGHSGFTLIELVVVITLLGILAAFAIPRFVSLDTNARTGARDALAGRVRSAAALSHALWLAQGQPATIAMEGQMITMVNGYPDLTTVNLTVGGLAGFTYAPATGVFLKTGAAATCTVAYGEAPVNAGPAITTGGAC